MVTIVFLVATMLLAAVATINAKKVEGEFDRYKPEKSENDTQHQHEKKLGDYRDNAWRLAVARVCAGIAVLTAIAAGIAIVFHIG